MAAISGKSGAVVADATSVAEITQWDADKEAALDPYRSSSTSGYQKVVVGGKKMSGSFNFKLSGSSPQIGTSPVIVEGGSYTLKLYLDGTRYYSVPAVLGVISISVDVNAGSAITGSATFESDGQWTEPTI